MRQLICGGTEAVSTRLFFFGIVEVLVRGSCSICTKLLYVYINMFMIYMTYVSEPLAWTRNFFPLRKVVEVAHILFLYPGGWKLRHFVVNTSTRPSGHGEHRGVSLEQKFGVIYVYAANDGKPGVIFRALGCGDWYRHLLHAAL